MYYIKLLLIFVFSCLANRTLFAQNQSDPFEKLKQLAKTKPIQKQDFRSKVIIRENDPSFKTFTQKPIQFKPFPMLDENGKAISAKDNVTITLTNGRKKVVNAGEFYSKMNELEESLNKKGYTLRNKNNILKSELTRNKKLYEGKHNTMPKSVGPLLNENQISQYLDPKIKVGNITLKPMSKYSVKEKQQIDKMYFANANNKIITKTAPAVIGKNLPSAIENTPQLKKELAYDFFKSWPSDREYLGDPKIFAVSVNAGFGLHAKAYSSSSPDNDPSVYSAYAKCAAKGSIFGNAFDILKAEANISMPAKVTANSSANLVLEIAGINVLNEHNDASTFQKTFSYNPSALNFDNSLSISIPIAGPLTFEGSVGVRGYAGLDYGFAVDKTNIILRLYPNAQISGYAEAGLGFVIGEVGVGAELTFLEVGFPLNGTIGFVVNNRGQLVIATSYNLGYKVRELNGRLYLYADFCLFKCWRIAEVDIFKFDGFVQQGAFAQGIHFDVIDK